MINGIVYDFESIKMQLPSGIVNSLEEISYKQGKDVDVKTDTKGVPRGTVRHAYEGDFSCRMSLHEFEMLQKAAGSRGIFSMDPVPIIVSFSIDGGPVVTDTLRVKITDFERQIAKDDEVTVSITGKQTDIMKAGGRPVYIPR